MALQSYVFCWRWYDECLPVRNVSDRTLDFGRTGRLDPCLGCESRRSISRCISAVRISLRLLMRSFSCSDGSAIGFFGSIFGLKSSHCFKTGGITGGFGLVSIFVNIALFFVGILLSTLFRIIGLLDFRLALISRLADPDTDLIADGTLDSDGTLADGTVDLWLAAEFWRDFALFALGDCDREGAVDCTCDGAVDLKLVSFSVCCLSRTCPGLKIFLSNFSFGQSVLHHQSKSLFKHN